MTSYDRPVWRLFEDCAADLPTPFTFDDVRRWFSREYPAIAEGTLRLHLVGLTDGPTRAQSNGWLASKPPLFRRVQQGTYMLVDSGAEVPAEPRPSPSATTSAGAHIYLVGCVKTRLGEPAPARDLYTSDLFVKARTHVELTGRPWFVLSAEHGLTAPSEWLAPYDRLLKDTPSWYRTSWGRWVVDRLRLLTGDLAGLTIEIHASSAYVDPIRSHLGRAGATVREPLAGLSQGKRLAWYTNRTTELGVRPEQPRRSSPSPPPAWVVEKVAAQLLDTSSARRPADLDGSARRALSQPGLYAWWVDDVGAGQLSAGLGHHVVAGPIYAGQAGATRWPSGQRSGNTLWQRLIDITSAVERSSPPLGRHWPRSSGRPCR